MYQMIRRHIHPSLDRVTFRKITFPHQATLSRHPMSFFHFCRSPRIPLLVLGDPFLFSFILYCFPFFGLMERFRLLCVPSNFLSLFIKLVNSLLKITWIWSCHIYLFTISIFKNDFSRVQS